MKLQQASSRNCFVCGVENGTGLQMRFFESDTDPRIVTAEYTVPKKYQGYPGIVHGGILAAMLDEVTSRTIMRGNPPRFVVTANLSLRYRKPVPVETPLRMVGRVVEEKGKIIIVDGEMFDLQDRLLTEARATLVEVDPSFFGAMTSFEEQGWRVYDNPADRSPDGSLGGVE